MKFGSVCRLRVNVYGGGALCFKGKKKASLCIWASIGVAKTIHECAKTTASVNRFDDPLDQPNIMIERVVVPLKSCSVLGNNMPLIEICHRPRNIEMPCKRLALKYVRLSSVPALGIKLFEANKNSQLCKLLQLKLKIFHPYLS